MLCNIYYIFMCAFDAILLKIPVYYLEFLTPYYYPVLPNVSSLVYVSSGPVPNQTTGPKKIFNYLIFGEARTGPHKSVCLYKTGPGILISVRLT